MISSYLIWNHHEEVEGEFDFGHDAAKQQGDKVIFYLPYVNVTQGSAFTATDLWGNEWTAVEATANRRSQRVRWRSGFRFVARQR